MGAYMTRLHSPVRGLQDCQILPDFLGFEVFVGCCLELDNIILEIIKSCLIYKCLEGSINSLKTILIKRIKR